jgi:hypothetical protein
VPRDTQSSEVAFRDLSPSYHHVVLTRHKHAPSSIFTNFILIFSSSIAAYLFLGLSGPLGIEVIVI